MNELVSFLQTAANSILDVNAFFGGWWPWW